LYEEEKRRTNALLFGFFSKLLEMLTVLGGLAEFDAS